jgi:hypothetical protein
MTWTKREPVTNLVVLGDEEGNKKKVGGLLIGCPKDRMYPDKTNYEIVQKDGEVQVLSGSASLRNQIGESDIGKFIKCEFTGWGKSANGKYKAIDVNVWDGEPDATMKAWPRYAEFANGATKKAAPAATKTKAAAPVDEFEEFPGALRDEDDDLPF